MDYKMLLSPGKIGTLELKNRFVVPAMGTNYSDVEGNVTDQMVSYYRKRAEGGFGLIITEVAAVDPRGKSVPAVLGAWKDEHVAELKKLADAIHEGGSKMVVQLHHCGRQTVPSNIDGQIPESASRIACPVNDVVPEQMTEERIWQLIEEYGDAALRAKNAGADGVEVHGGHGYLIAQFMSTHSNRRTDDFGGSFTGRMKFPIEIFKNIRSKVGEDYPMTFRFGSDEKVPGGRTLEESIAVARMAEENGVDALHITLMTYQSMHHMAPSAAMPAGFNQTAAKILKEAVSIPVISVGRYSVEIAENALLSGCADYIAFGRESLADPELPNKVKEGRIEDICPCIACTQSCLGYVFAGKPISCLVNPSTGNEYLLDNKKTDNPKNVVVVGSGPAGLEAAMVAAQKGHKVTVFEKSDEIGGQFRLASVPPTKHEIATAIKYFIRSCKQNGVEFVMNTEVDAAKIKELNPDACILATGGLQAKPGIPGIDGANVVFATDILDGKVTPGRNVLVLGGGMTGVETADFLAQHNRAVTVLEMRSDIALDEEAIPRAFLMPRLMEEGVAKIVNATVKTINEDGVTYTQDGQEITIGGYDTIALALGVRSNNPLEDAIRETVKEVYVIGDAVKAGPANAATEAGLAAALQLG